MSFEYQLTGDSSESSSPSELDYRFVQHQLGAHIEIAQWKPDPHAFEATPECWRRAFAIAHLQAAGIHGAPELAASLGVTENLVEEDLPIVPYLDRTIAGLLAMLGWYVSTNY